MIHHDLSIAQFDTNFETASEPRYDAVAPHGTGPARVAGVSDTHCHLCVGLDDGPQNMQDAVAMCEQAWREGARRVACVAHQNDAWPDVTPDRILAATAALAARLAELHCPLELVPAGEVMISSHTFQDYQAGKLLTFADAGRYLLLEMPNGRFVDIRPLVRRLVDIGVSPVLAHAERYPQLLFGGRRVDDIIRCGCMIQVTSSALARPADRRTRKALKDWAIRGVIHTLGSDAHSPRWRRPILRSAVQQLRRWVGLPRARAIAVSQGAAVLYGRSLCLPLPNRSAANLWGRWFSS